MRYPKVPLTYQQQVALWQSRGLVVADLQRAEKYLQDISYYRLSAYALPFQQVKDTFNSGTTFDQILDLYIFDRELRLIVFDALERIEIALRAQLIYQLSHKYGSHWQDDANIFKPASYNKAGRLVYVFAETQKIIVDSCNAKYPEVFIKHYRKKYSKPANPPSWMCMELLSIGQLSRLYAALKDNADRKDIAAHFSLHQTIFESWLHTLTYGRNVCAHHARLWNREFGVQPTPMNNPSLPWIDPSFNNNNRRTFFFLCIVKYFLQTINPKGHFKNRFVQLLKDHPHVPIQYMGIPTDKNTGQLLNWIEEPLWKQ